MVFGRSSDDGECDETWENDGHEAECRRDAIVTVDGVSYCSEHASKAPITDR